MGFQLITAPSGAPVLGYGNEYPSVVVPEGLLFVRTDLARLYIRESNAWSEVLDADPSAAPSFAGLTLTGALTGTSLDLSGAAEVDGVASLLGGFLVGSANGPQVHRARVTVDTAAITGLNATPVELVAAVSGKIAVPLYMAISKTATTAHEDAALDGNLVVQTSSGTQIGASIEADGFVDDTTAETAFWVPGTALVVPHADAGDALQLANDGTAFSDGGSADTAFVIELLYILVDPVDPAA